MTCSYGEEDRAVMKITVEAKNVSRLQELIDFAKICGYKKLGVANCKGVQPYANKLVELLKAAGFDVVSMNCRQSGMDGAEICDSMAGSCCDPLSQAEFMNKEKTDFNINVGLCLGHGLLFTKHSQAQVTTFLVKDFRTGHKTIQNLE